MSGVDIPIESESDIVIVRTRGREMARELGFGLIDQTRIATAISEVSRNILMYAHRGKVRLSPVHRGAQQGLEMVASDKGPGIANLEAVLQGRGSTSRGLGLGIPGTRRLMDDFDIASSAEEGTTIRCVKWLQGRL